MTTGTTKERHPAGRPAEREAGRDELVTQPPAASVSRRHFLFSTAAGAAAASLARPARAQQPEAAGEALGERVLIRGGCVLTVDAELGDFEQADVLIEGARIAAIGPDLEADAEDIIDASGMIVMPGFVDTHRHMWQGSLRNILPDGLLSDYGRDITGAARAVYRPEDAHVGDLVSALGAINAGVTTVLDWSHIGNSPEHTDAAIAGLRESGIRAVYAYGGGTPGPANRFPDDLRRLRAEHFSSEDQLLTLALAAGGNVDSWRLARDLGAFISVHVVGSMSEAMMGALAPDVTCIHCTNLQPQAWRRIADTGAGVSIAGPIEMQMSHGVPPIQECLEHGITPSLSVDVETQQPSEFFTQMRSVFALQRMLALQSQQRGEAEEAFLLSVKDVIEYATLQGAKDNHLEHKVGSLTPGKEADIILLRAADDFSVLPLNNAYGAVVLSMDTANVDTVFIAGKLRKRHGRLVDVDVERVRRLAEASRDHVRDEAGWPRTVLGGYAPGH